jgi:hypothetical protein
VRRVALVVCALALAGCGSSGGKATVSRSELPATVLQKADVPSSWTQFADGKQARIDLRIQPGGRQSPTRFGREDGWISRYRGTQHRSPVVVESRADVFDGVSGAKKDLAAYRDEIKAGIVGSGATPKLLPAPALGDGSVAGELRQGPSVFIVVAWRRANETASVTLEGRAAAATLADAVELAGKQDKRLAVAARA